MIELLQGDCLELMKGVPDESVDLIITSPPYNIGKMKSNTTIHGTYAGNDMEEDNYQDWQVAFLNECYRVLKDNGSMFYNHKVRIKKGVAIHPLEWVLKADFLLKQEITWDMGKSANCDKIRFFPFSERIYWLVKNPKTKLHNTHNLSDVWRVVPTHKRKETGHIAVMPLEIVTYILESITGEVVLDPFMGSGTTGVACKNLNRNFIGMELDETYFEIAKNRIENHVVAIEE
jgi:site-specific DNA-methyltransferase (adenine-specific)